MIRGSDLLATTWKDDYYLSFKGQDETLECRESVLLALQQQSTTLESEIMWGPLLQKVLRRESAVLLQSFPAKVSTCRRELH